MFWATSNGQGTLGLSGRRTNSNETETVPTLLFTIQECCGKPWRELGDGEQEVVLFPVVRGRISVWGRW